MLAIKYFGMLAESTGVAQEELEFSEGTVADLRSIILERYPALEKMNFQIAVAQSIAENHLMITGNEEIALLPPFAGG